MIHSYLLIIFLLFLAQLWPHYAEVHPTRPSLLDLGNEFETSGTSNRNNGPAGRRQVHWSRNPQDVRRSNKYVVHSSMYKIWNYLNKNRKFCAETKP